MKNSASIITMVKYEHDFINQWIEYHMKLGFSHFYILIDNIQDVQPEYEINEMFKENVTLINCTEDTVIRHFGCSTSDYNNKSSYNHHHSFYLHQLLNFEIINKNIIKEYWVTAIGIDQFIYMNGLTIQQYLENILEECTQIILPWSMCCYNNTNSPFDYFMKNVNSYKYSYGYFGHSNGLIKTKELLKLCGDSHSFVSKSPRQQVYIINEYFTMDSELLSLGNDRVFDKVFVKMNGLVLEDLKISSFHFFLRNVQEIIIKRLCYWNFINGTNIIDCIKNKYKEIKDERIGNSIVNSYPELNLNIPDITCLNTDTIYNKIIISKLNEVNISEEEYREWLNIFK